MKPIICITGAKAPVVPDNCPEWYWLVTVNSVDEITAPDRDHAYILPNGTLYVLGHDDRLIAISGSGGGDTDINLDNYYTKEEIDKISVGRFYTYEDNVGEIFGDYENNYTQGNHAHAEGSNNRATGDSSHAEGSGNRATGDSSHAEGSGNRATGKSSHAEGYYTTSTGASSHAEGESTMAAGEASHAEGSNNTAVGKSSHVEGEATMAEGDRGHAEGHWTRAKGEASHAEGCSTEANGDYSHAGGYKSVTEGESGFAHGDYLENTSDYGAVFGKYNLDNGSLFSVGNGTVGERKNAFAITDDGLIHFYSRDGKLTVLQEVIMPDAPADGKRYVRQNGKWVPLD